MAGRLAIFVTVWLMKLSVNFVLSSSITTLVL